MIVSDGQQRYSAIHVQVSILPQTSLPSRLPYNTEQSSQWYTVGPYWLSILNTAVCTCRSQTPYLSPTLLPHNHKFNSVSLVNNHILFIQQLYWTPSLYKSLENPPKVDKELHKKFLLMRLLKINGLAYPVALKNVKSSRRTCSLYHFLQKPWEFWVLMASLYFQNSSSFLVGIWGHL